MRSVAHSFDGVSLFYNRTKCVYLFQNNPSMERRSMESDFLNISFMVMKGQTVQALIRSNFTMADFREVVASKFEDVSDLRFVIGSKQIDLNDETRFNQLKHLIKNGVTIFVLQRMSGGATSNSDLMEIPTLIKHLLQQLPNEMGKMRKYTANCFSCHCDEQCMKVCCTYLCPDCFPNYYKTTNFNLKCCTCHRKLDYTSFFVSSTFKNLIAKLVQSQELVINIDCQICRCGALLWNETMYSQQKCNRCNRTLCFFCNKDWNSSTMRNDKFTCHSNCDYETRITYDLVPTHFNANLMVPNRRCCPKCFHTGAFGDRCKYHVCYSCGYNFCFICLEEENTCKRKYANVETKNDFYRRSCRDIVKQTYSIFPRLNS